MDRINNGSLQDTLIDDYNVDSIDSDEMADKYLTFISNDNHLGIPIADVVQIIGVQDITPIPEFPSYAKGIINLRGSIIPVIDMRLRLSEPETTYTERTCIIVTSVNKTEIGFIVDLVDEVTTISKESIVQAPRYANAVNRFVVGIGKVGSKVVLLMDTQKILSKEAVLQLSSNI